MKKYISHLQLLILIVLLHACVEGETDEIYETVRAAVLGIENIVLSKEHEDNLRAGRQIQISANAELESGSTQDISNEVNWSVNDTTLLIHEGDGLFTAQAGKAGTAIVTSSFAGISAEISVVISTAALESIVIEAVNFEGESIIDLKACSTLAFKAMGTYEGEAATRNESDYVTWQTDNGSFDATTFSNSNVDINSGAVSVNFISAVLDNIDSNSITMNYPAIDDGTSLSISPNSGSTLIMGEQQVYSATWNDGSVTDVSDYVIWIASAKNADTPMPSATFTGADLKANIVTDDVVISDNSEYAVEVAAICSGLSSSENDTVTIASDITQMELNEQGVDLSVGEVLDINLTLTHVDDSELTAEDISNSDDIVWEIVDEDSDDDASDYMSFVSTGKLSRRITIEEASDIGSDFSFSIRVNYHGFEQQFSGFKILEAE